MNQLGKPHGALGVSDYDGIISPAYFVAQIGPAAEPRFMHHLLRTRLYISEYERRGKFMPPSQFDISWDQFRSIEVVLPPISEQRAIARFLDAETARIDTLIAKKRRLIELLDERFITYRSQLVLRGVNPITGVGDLPPDWRCCSLGVCIQLQRGHDLPEQSRVPGDVPIISSGGVSGWHSVAAESGPGVVTGRYGTIGDAYFVEGPYWPLNTTLYVKDFRSHHPRWVLHLLSSLPLASESDKSAVTGINRNVVGLLRVPLPPPDEQRQIARAVEASRMAIDATRAPLTRQIDLLVEHRQALVTAAVTGELAVPGAA